MKIFAPIHANIDRLRKVVCPTKQNNTLQQERKIVEMSLQIAKQLVTQLLLRRSALPPLPCRELARKSRFLSTEGENSTFRDKHVKFPTKLIWIFFCSRSKHRQSVSGGAASTSTAIEALSTDGARWQWEEWCGEGETEAGAGRWDGKFELVKQLSWMCSMLILVDEKKEQEKQWKRMKLGFYMFGIGGVGFSAYSLYELAQPELDSDGEFCGHLSPWNIPTDWVENFLGNPIRDEFSDLPPFEQYKSRILKSFNYYQKFVQEPSFDKLLPDPLKYPYVQPKYTLVLEMVSWGFAGI